MALHMIKLCVGVENVDELAEWQVKRAAERKKKGKSPNPFHDTRMHPKRAAEMLEGGSLYWVIKHFTIVRQKLIGFEEVKDKDGKPMCRIHLDPEAGPHPAAQETPLPGLALSRTRRRAGRSGRQGSGAVGRPGAGAEGSAGVVGAALLSARSPYCRSAASCPAAPRSAGGR